MIAFACGADIPTAAVLFFIILQCADEVANHYEYGSTVS